MALTGLDGGIYIQAATGTTPTTLTGDLWNNVKDVSFSSPVATADVSTRANSGWRSQLPTLRDLTITIQAQFEDDDSILDAVRTAWTGNSNLEVTFVSDTTAGAAYEGFVGVFFVSE